MMIRSVLLLLVAALHIYFMILEMFLWTKPIGLKLFGMSQEKALSSAALASNQGLYNGFLALGLIWAVFHPNKSFSSQLAIFFCGCVIVAALYGAWSVSAKILWVQGLPALIALIATLVIKNR